MGLSQKESLIFLSLLSLLFVAFGCAPPAYRAHPELEIRSKNITTPQLIPPDMKIYELTAGGVKELRDDWCSTGRENVLKSLMEAFKEKQIEIKMIPIDKDIEEELEDIQALYRAVSTSILLHTYNKQFLFPEKQKNFDYSIGPVDKILQKYNTDALIFVYGIDEISTGGRKALTAAGIVIGAFTGIMVVPRAGMTAVSVALIDSSGTVLWYSVKGSGGGHDLRDYESCANLVKDILSDFPNLKK